MNIGKRANIWIKLYEEFYPEISTDMGNKEPLPQLEENKYDFFTEQRIITLARMFKKVSINDQVVLLNKYTGDKVFNYIMVQT